MSRPRLLAPVGLLLLALFFWRLGGGLSEGLPLAEGVTLRSVTPLTAADYEQMARTEKRAGEETPLVLWTQLDGREVVSAALERTAKASLVLTRGDTRLLFPAALAGEDTVGALVDAATARALFGMGDPVGARIECLGKERVIRGLVDTPLPTVVLRAASDDETPLENVTFRSPRKEAFLLRHGLDGLLTENGVWSDIAGFVCALPAAAACLWGFLLLGRAAVRWRFYPARQAVVLGALLVFAALCALWLLSALPADWVPPRWSDFGFWPDRFDRWRREALEFLASPKYRSDLYIMAKAARAGVCGILSLAALAICGKVTVDFLPRRWYNGQNGGVSMMISTRGRYALRLMIDLAQHDNGGYIALKDVCARQEISLKYLEQIVGQLSKAGLLKSARGAQGGYRLAKAPEEYTAGAILCLTEGSLAPVACLENQPNECSRSEHCVSLPFWQGLYRVVDEYVEGVTLADLAGEQDQAQSRSAMPVYFL